MSNTTQPRIVSKGRHIAKGLEFEHGQGNNGTMFIRVHMRITEGEFTHYTLPWDGWLTEAALETTRRSLLAMGWDGMSLSEPVGLTSRSCVIEVDHEYSEERGRSYPRVQWVNQLGGRRLSAERTMSDTDRRFLDEKFSEALNPKGGEARPGRSYDETPAAPRSGAPSDDDIPF